MPNASLGDTVFLDEDQDGIQDPGEEGVEGVTVMLLDCNGAVLDTVTTDANGNYSFTDLAPNMGYVVMFVAPDGFELSLANQGGDDTVDSDADANGKTACTVLAPGENNSTLDVGIIEIDDCDISVEVEASAKEVCGIPVELTAVIEDSAACPGGCVYPVIEQDRCEGATGSFEVFLKFDEGFRAPENKFKASQQSFETFANGNARYTATASNGVDNITIVVDYTGFTENAPIGSPKLNDCLEFDTSDWVYWTNTSGTLISENHGTFILSQRGPAFQLGVGADIKRTGFGASGWFDTTGGDGFYTNGDINIAVGSCEPKGFDLLWTTNDGNIVGQDNSLSVNVDQPGTYSVSVVNCIGCDAIASFTLDECPSGGREGAIGSIAYTRDISGMFPVPAACGGNLTIQIGDNLETMKSEDAANLSKVPQTQEVSVTIYNIEGSMVQTPRLFNINPGQDAINLQVPELAAGAYFIVVDGLRWADSKQIIIK